MSCFSKEIVALKLSSKNLLAKKFLNGVASDLYFISNDCKFIYLIFCAEKQYL